MSKSDQTSKVHIVDDSVRITNGQISPVIDQLPPPPQKE